MIMIIATTNVGVKRNNNTNLRNPKYKSYLNNDNSVDNSKNNNSNKKYIFILGGSIVKNLNGFCITKIINPKCIVKVSSFSPAKVHCMYNHVRDVNPVDIILYFGNNDLNSERTSNHKINY